MQAFIVNLPLLRFGCCNGLKNRHNQVWRASALLPLRVEKIKSEEDDELISHPELCSEVKYAFISWRAPLPVQPSSGASSVCSRFLKLNYYTRLHKANSFNCVSNKNVNLRELLEALR